MCRRTQSLHASARVTRKHETNLSTHILSHPISRTHTHISTRTRTPLPLSFACQRRRSLRRVVILARTLHTFCCQRFSYCCCCCCSCCRYSSCSHGCCCCPFAIINAISSVSCAASEPWHSWRRVWGAQPQPQKQQQQLLQPYIYVCVCVSVCIWQRRRPTSDTIISHVAFLVAAPTRRQRQRQRQQRSQGPGKKPNVASSCRLLPAACGWSGLLLIWGVRGASCQFASECAGRHQKGRNWWHVAVKAETTHRQGRETSYRQMLSNCHDNQNAYRYCVTRVMFYTKNILNGT